MTGTFIAAHDGFHNAEGLVRVIPLGDGSTILRLENFNSTNGPNVHLYLATDKATSNFIDLGRLKANNGNQNYNISHDTDLTKYNMALIWCKDFSVLFGSAQLENKPFFKLDIPRPKKNQGHPSIFPIIMESTITTFFNGCASPFLFLLNLK
jgi:hypothetical protein